MDLDGDGKTDILSGSYHPGHLYLFRRGPEGQFLPGEKIKDRHGKELEFVAAVPFAADWNGDGLLDLIVGNIQGEVYFIPNEGTPKQYAFGSPQKLEADGKPIQVPHGDAGPVVADWDGDKIPDLLVGCGDGSVIWYRNIGTAKAPKLAAGKTLVKACPINEVWSGGLKENQCGARAKICVADWNGDGKLDLILGDLSVSKGEEPQLTKEEREAVDKAQKRQNELMQEWMKIAEEEATLRNTLSAKDPNRFGDTFRSVLQAGTEMATLEKPSTAQTAVAKTEREKKLRNCEERFQQAIKKLAELQNSGAQENSEARTKREAKLGQIYKKYTKLQAELIEVSQLARKGQAQSSYHGHVWVFLRQGPVAAKP